MMMILFFRNGLKQSVLALMAFLLLFSGVPAEARTVVPDVYAAQKRLLTKFYYEAVIQVASQGGLASATDLMKNVYLLNPDNLSVAFGYGQFLESSPDLAPAIAFYTDLLEQFSEPEQQALLLYRISVLQDAMNAPEKAIKSLEKAIDLLSEKKAPSVFYYDLGVYYAKVDRFPMTALYSQKALEISPTSAAAWNNLGYSLARQGKLTEGLEAVQKSLMLEPQNPNAVDSLGYIYYQMGRYTDAITEYEKAVTLDPKLSESWLYLGHTYTATLTLDKAVRAYERFIQLAPTHAEKASVEKKLLELKSNLLIEVAPTTTSQAQPE